MRDELNTRCYVNHLLAEHRRLHFLQRQMRTAVGGSVGPDEQPSFAGVVQALVRLREELTRHFAEEEGGGCLDEAVSRCPSLSGDEQRITDEHPQLLAALDRLIEQARTQPPTHQTQLAIEREFDRICEQLRQHEQAENALLSRAFGVGINGDDCVPAPLTLDT
jgi:hypothetical protein